MEEEALGDEVLDVALADVVEAVGVQVKGAVLGLDDAAVLDDADGDVEVLGRGGGCACEADDAAVGLGHALQRVRVGVLEGGLHLGQVGALWGGEGGQPQGQPGDLPQPQLVVGEETPPGSQDAVLQQQGFEGICREARGGEQTALLQILVFIFGPLEMGTGFGKGLCDRGHQGPHMPVIIGFNVPKLIF